MGFFISPVGSGSSGGGTTIELSDSITSTSTTTAASSLAVKKVNDKIETKADADHNHNDLYYQKSEADLNLSNALNNIDYNDLKNKPNSTVAQIDNAVTKIHDIDNWDSLSQLTVEDGILYINGVPYMQE